MFIHFYTNVEDGKKGEHSNDDTDCAFMLIQFFYDQHSITSKNNTSVVDGDKETERERLFFGNIALGYSSSMKRRVFKCS